MGKSKELAELGDVVTQSNGILSINDTTDPTAGGFAPKLHVKQGANGVFGGFTVEGHDTDVVGGLGYNSTDQTFQLAASYRFTSGYKPLAFHAGGQERMRIDEFGRVTMPYQPAFFVSHQTINTGGIVNYQTVVTNIGNYWSTANSRFTAPVSGTYTFSAGALHDVDNSYIMFYKNGGLSHTQYGYLDMVEDQASITCVLTLSAGDYMQVWQNLDTEGNGHSWFCGYLIG